MHVFWKLDRVGILLRSKKVDNNVTRLTNWKICMLHYRISLNFPGPCIGSIDAMGFEKTLLHGVELQASCNEWVLGMN